MTVGSKAISFLSGEWMLSSGRPNGGDVVVFRTLWVGVLLVVLLAIVRATSSSPTNLCGFASATACKALDIFRSAEGPVIFGAVYAALYARFASQWAYVANLYNQIKQAEVGLQTGGAEALAQWKAGFIEDALAVHMATKPTVKGVIDAWHRDAKVSEAFRMHTPDFHAKIAWLQKHRVLKP